MPTDIGTQTQRVGNALSSVRIDEMITNLAKGIAWGQYELDKVGVDVTKMMGVPGAVTIGNERLSMLDAGFLPSFYQFVDTILELRMEVRFREEEATHLGVKETNFQSYQTESGGEVSTNMKVGFWGASFEAGLKANWKNESKSAYTRTVDASHAQKYNQEINASSLMRTKLVPKPPPEVLVERIRILLEQLRKEAEAEARDEAQHDDRITPENIGDRIMTLLMGKLEQKLLGRFEGIVKKSSGG
jgi:hypothetical protein